MRQMKKVMAAALALVTALGISGCNRLQISKELATINGQMVSVAEYKYYLESIKQQMVQEAGATDEDTFWNGEIDGKKASDAAKERATEEMLRVEIAYSKAQEKGLSLDSATENQINTLVNAKDKQTKAQVDSIKESTGLSNRQLKTLLIKTSLASKYAQEIQATEPEKLEVSDEQAQEKYESDYARVKHILILNSKEDSEDEAVDESAEDTAEDTAENTAEPQQEEISEEEYKQQQKQLAEEVLAKVKAGEDFEALLAQYGQDPGMTSNPDGYTIDKEGNSADSQGSKMVTEFTQGAFSVAVGETTDLVESSYGWHIIKRYALPTSGEIYDSAIQTVKSSLMQDKYNELIDSYKSEFDIQIRQKVIDKIKVNK